MSHDITHTLFQHVFRHLHRAHPRIHLGSLYKTHIIHQLNHIMIHKYRCLNNLGITWIDPRGSHGIRNPDRSVINTIVFQVSRIKFRIIRRKILSSHHIFKPNFLESLIPLQNSFTNRLLPSLREFIIHVENNLFHGFNQFTPFIRFHIFRAHIPFIGKSNCLHFVRIFRQLLLRRSKIPDTRVSNTGVHDRFFR